MCGFTFCGIQLYEVSKFARSNFNLIHKSLSSINIRISFVPFLFIILNKLAYIIFSRFFFIQDQGFCLIYEQKIINEHLAITSLSGVEFREY